MGGFWILEAADMDEALAWARKGAISCNGWARCANFYSSRTRMQQRNSLAAARWRRVVAYNHLDAPTRRVQISLRFRMVTDHQRVGRR
jgi:hypothetical protein